MIFNFSLFPLRGYISRRACSFTWTKKPDVFVMGKRQKRFSADSRARLITTAKCPMATLFTIMLASESYTDLFVYGTLPNHLLEVLRSKISRHHAKKGDSYPMIRLPYILSKLAGLPTRIYQSVYEGALAFLVAISPAENASESLVSSVLTWQNEWEALLKSQFLPRSNSEAVKRHGVVNTVRREIRGSLAKP
jgi:hypothetical protein